jgi:hypothetical protein
LRPEVLLGFSAPALLAGFVNHLTLLFPLLKLRLHSAAWKNSLSLTLLMFSGMLLGVALAMGAALAILALESVNNRCN